MNPTSLQHKTIRPGSLGTYSYYHSARRPAPALQVSKPKRSRGATGLRNKIVGTLLVGLALLVLPLLRPFGGGSTANGPIKASSQAAAAVVPAAQTQAVATPAPAGPCADNKLDKIILVSVSQRHLWACEGSKQVHDTPVITGITTHADTTTPPGTYHIYAKQTDTVLRGSDSVSSWNDNVSYWMPFLDNEHGTYGFHDAMWRGGEEFGNVDPSSDEASHGCVELPLASSHWLYDWATKGTTVTIES